MAMTLLNSIKGALRPLWGQPKKRPCPLVHVGPVNLLAPLDGTSILPWIADPPQQSLGTCRSWREPLPLLPCAGNPALSEKSCSPLAPPVCSHWLLHTGSRGSNSYFACQRKEPMLSFPFRTRQFGKYRVMPRTGTFLWCRWLGWWSLFSRVRSSQSEISPWDTVSCRVVLPHPYNYVFFLSVNYSTAPKGIMSTLFTYPE